MMVTKIASRQPLTADRLLLIDDLHQSEFRHTRVEDDSVMLEIEFHAPLLHGRRTDDDGVTKKGRREKG
jgi:hypothetical protein